MQASNSSKIVKVAIQANNQTSLFIFNQEIPLDLIIQDICNQCKVNYEQNKFSLQLLPSANGTESFKYITETNRYIVKNGNELRLVYSPALLSKMIAEKLDIKQVPIETLSWALQKAAKCSSDMIFCKEFYQSAYPELRHLLNKSLLTKELYNNALKIILNLIKSNYLKDVDKEFLNHLKKIITSDQNIEEGIVEKGLSILEAIILSIGSSEFVTKQLDLDDFIHHIWSRDSPNIQSNALAVINAMGLKCSNLRKQRLIILKMNSTSLKDNIYMNIILTDALVPAYLAHELHVYQSLSLTLEKERYRNIADIELMLTKLVPLLESGELQEEIKRDIEKELFVSRRSKRISSSQNEAKEGDLVSLAPSISSSVLYGSDEEDEDDDEDTTFIPEPTRPEFKKGKAVSKLTHDCVCYFYSNHKKDFAVALIEEGGCYKKLLQMCEQIVQIICTKVLKMGNIPENNEINYCPLFFLTAQPFLEELFSKSVTLFLKTKREMKARSSSDLEKVYQVLQKQLVAALTSQPANYDQLDSVLGTLSYWTVRNQWQEEQIQRERHTLANSPAIKQLKQSLVPETKLLIRKQRLQCIKNKTEFPVWNTQRHQKVKNKTWCAFLSANEKAINYYEKEDEIHQLPIHDIIDLLTGKRCPHIKESKSRATSGELAFSLVTEDSSLDFIAPTQEVYDNWTDAINSLLGKEMKSILMKRDLKILLEMEVRLRLLDTEGIDLPTEPPPIPLEPSNYDFTQP